MRKGDVMSTASTSKGATLQESDLLVPFESQNIPDEYKEYYKAKRNNFFATIHRFSGMWKYYIFLDQIWERGFESLKPVRDPKTMFPVLLYCNAHAKIRVSIELGFSGCMAASPNSSESLIGCGLVGQRNDCCRIR
jgi:hypothetical protein